jgi:hypothetical protein
MRVVGKSVKRSLVTILVLSALFLLVFHSASLAIDDSLWQAFEQAVPLVEAPGSPFELEDPANVVVTGDVNEDGHMDIVLAGFNLSIWLGDGYGGFSALPKVNLPITTSLAGRSLQMVIGDFKEDNHLDLAISDATTGMLLCLLGDGTGHFHQANNSPLPVVNEPSALITGDLDHDGHLDFIVADSTNKVFVSLLGDGTGHFIKVSENSLPGHFFDLIYEDFNEDEYGDLVVAGFGGQLLLLRGGEGGNFGEPMISEIGMGPKRIDVGDFDEDGDLDLVVSNEWSGSLTMLLNDGKGGFSIGSLYEEETPGDILAEDFNGDGHLDFAILQEGISYLGERYGKCSMYFGAGSGDFIGPVPYVIGPLLRGVISGITPTVGDFNEDGYPDIAFNTQNSLQPPFGLDVLISASEDKARYTKLIRYAQRSIYALAEGDFNADGHRDLVVGDLEAISVWLGNGKAVYLAVLRHLHPFLTVSQPVVGLYSLISGDFDKDGYDDLVHNYRGIQDPLSISVLLNKNGEEFKAQSSVEIGVPSPRAPLLTLDWNGDENLDLVVGGPNSMFFLLGDGRGEFTKPIDYPIDGGVVTCLTSGDFNADGYIDIAAVTLDKPALVTLFGDGRGGTAEVLYQPLDNGSNTLVNEDFDDDGFQDLILVDYEGKLVLFGGDESGTFSSRVIAEVALPEDFKASWLGSGDFNGDVLPDLAIGLVNVVPPSLDDAHGPLLLINEGSEGFRAISDFGLSPCLTPLLITDLDADGREELVTTGHFSMIIIYNFYINNMIHHYR